MIITTWKLWLGPNHYIFYHILWWVMWVAPHWHRATCLIDHLESRNMGFTSAAWGNYLRKLGETGALKLASWDCEEALVQRAMRRVGALDLGGIPANGNGSMKFIPVLDAGAWSWWEMGFVAPSPKQPQSAKERDFLRSLGLPAVRKRRRGRWRGSPTVGISLW